MNPGGIPPLHQSLLDDPTLEIGDQPRAPLLQEFLAAWSAWPKTGPLPRRAAFDPIDFPRLLHWIGLQEFTGHPNRYRAYDALYRYVGSSRAELFRAANMTGTYVSAMQDPFPERWFSVYDQLIERRTPLVVRGRPYLVAKAFMRFEMLVLPLCRNDDAAGETVAFNLSCVQVEAA